MLHSGLIGFRWQKSNRHRSGAVGNFCLGMPAGSNPAPATINHFSRTFRDPSRRPSKFAVLYYLTIGGAQMIAKDNVTIGIEWRFGPDWPGQRCSAKTRRGTPCQSPANKRNGRCRLHGGRSTGPKSAEGRAKIAAANLRHGEFTQAKQASQFLVHGVGQRQRFCVDHYVS